MNTRRIFLKNLSNVAAVSAFAVTAGLSMEVKAQAQKISESDPQAKALGYVDDSARADKSKFPKHTTAQRCDNCQLFQGKAGDPQAPCAVFGGKLVAGPGWCSAYTKKAG
jgi:hypothetical protein